MTELLTEDMTNAQLAMALRNNLSLVGPRGSLRELLAAAAARLVAMTNKPNRQDDRLRKVLERCLTCDRTDAEYANGTRSCNDPWHCDNHLRTSRDAAEGAGNFKSCRDSDVEGKSTKGDREAIARMLKDRGFMSLDGLYLGRKYVLDVIDAILSLRVQPIIDKTKLYTILSRSIPSDMIDGIWQELKEAGVVS